MLSNLRDYLCVCVCGFWVSKIAEDGTNPDSVIGNTKLKEHPPRFLSSSLCRKPTQVNYALRQVLK